MSHWQTSELGHLDPDSAFREYIFEEFRQKLGQMNSSSSTTTPQQHAFEARVGDVKSPKSNINSLILDFLIMEGYPNAAAKFSMEANLGLKQEDTSILTRQEILHAIHSGNIEGAISALNELDPELLDMNPGLHFSLLLLQLVELIRESSGGDIKPALDFATHKVAPRAATSEAHKKQFERVMMLFFYDDPKKLSPDLKALLSPDLRRITASKVNEAVLLRQDQRKEAAMRDLVRLRAWTENTARARGQDLPRMIDLGLNNDTGNNDTGDDDTMELNGHEPMITT
ncbi:CTLH/CRA C-terminal to lish motif domain-containing protein [Podospora australis]|uniref:CTLH/CRA C-terminal to lish motif domain-containing protein n=1 Tax=Podospora australis TaxID=1536484 RepID=A0AAN7AET2_9PEZI|nr:CTLH/CRA C-terminal to lish motif domain-containing protein [Podospora australis]